jgi:3-methyladenine DNA glycosylase AlkD
MVSKIKKQIKAKSSKEKAKILSSFFKTGKGQYGEGDIFLGVTVPELRKIAKANKEINLDQVKELLESKIHEERFVALQILKLKYLSAKNKKQIADFYLKNRKNINNWDLIDTSAHYILGSFLKDKDKKILYKLARSKNLWDKRISIISTFAFIYEKKFTDTIKIAEILISDKHDLIHKAVGWMLREVGKRDDSVLKNFLNKNSQKMPRTMLRYAIEKFPENQRKKFLL